MDNESEKTRAEILDLLSSMSKRTSKDEDLTALFQLLNIPSEKSDILKVVRRAEREYFLICARATAREGSGEKKGKQPDGVPEMDCLEGGTDGSAGFLTGAGSVEKVLERLQRAEDGNSPEVVLIDVAVEAGKLMGAETALVALLESSGGTYTCRAAAGPRAIDCLGMTLPVAEASVCGWVIRQNIHFTSADAGTDMRCGPVFRKIVQAGAVAAAPLVDNGVLIGAIAVANGRGGAAFTKRETCETLVPFAENAARLLAAIGPVHS